MLVSIAQLNLHVGNIESNTRKIISCITKAREDSADLIVFPEMAITGYPPEDLLLRPAFLDQANRALAQIANHAVRIGVVIGHTRVREGQLFNSLSYLRDGEVQETYDKKHLPNYGVFDEKRYFAPGSETKTIVLGPMPIALCICEDLWEPEHARSARDAGAKLLISVNASPFRTNVSEQRKELLRTRAVETGLAILYVNLVGGQDELVFDGGSMVVDDHGLPVFQAPDFEEGQYLIEISESVDGLKFHSRTESAEKRSTLSSIYRCLTLGVRDYVRKSGFEGVIVGLSGGIDSALTTAIAVDALGTENVSVLLMPSRYTADMSTLDAIAMAETLGVPHHIIPIEKPFAAFTDALSTLFMGLPVDTTEESIQARCRGVLLMAISNKTGKLLLTTSNKSEMAVGAAAIYGDMAGGFAPLKDVSKTLVYELACWRNSKDQIIPQRMIDRLPSAELRPNQLDSDSRPPYDILDPIIERYVELDQSAEDIVGEGFSAEVVGNVISKIYRNEFKRRQGAPGVKITERAFGRERRYPIASGFRECIPEITVAKITDVSIEVEPGMAVDHATNLT
ncbi:NAD+ synthase [Rhodanobacter sp. C05]|uniref:NAD+ synthase n=1 Tax=Rhodanobacter sp. C05 TaxID=1945855 RepID=UPI0009846AE3|nr:NAD+ synthase [Rhodanobacter sp. C05]OOG43460.1 NAD+ synthase [Rhodanobacter sp. C05]